MEDENCLVCGARPKHQRLTDRRCLNCDQLFDVTSEESLQKYCERSCQLIAYNEKRRNQK